MDNSPVVGTIVGVDVGGTFTDFVLFDSQRQQRFFHKQPSTPTDPAQAVSQGLQAILRKSDLPASALTLILHGTTLGLNAIIQRRGADIALVITRGFRDVLEIARARMPSSFDFHADREPPFLPRQKVVEIPARFSPSGTVTQWPDDDELAQVASDILRLNVSAVELVTINGYANPEREAELAALLADKLGSLPVLSSAQLWPEIREYERTLIAGLNAYIQPLMQTYFQRLNDLLSQQTIDVPLLITASNGGVLPLDTAQQRPVDTLLSGPASGVIAAAQLAAGEGFVSFDMGGTSSDISLSAQGEIERVNRTEIGGLPLILPVVGVSAIGAGGGSIVQVDDYGILKVGPESAGADPGPVAYQRGGTRPTLTDCYLVSGILSADARLAGSISLDHQASHDALRELGSSIDFTAEQAASGAIAVATAQMATELNKALAQRGLTADGLTLIPFGGAGPTHANFFAEEAGINRILVPLRPGTFCAEGAISADIRRDFVRSLRTNVTTDTFIDIAGTIQELHQLAEHWFSHQAKHLSDAAHYRVEADMRYAGQAYELSVNLGSPDGINYEQIVAHFQQLHQQRYGFITPDATVQLTTLRLALNAPLPRPAEKKPALQTARQGPVQRQLWLRGAWVNADIWQRRDVSGDSKIDGPAVIEQEDTTTLVLSGWTARTDVNGNLIITRKAGDLQ
ncbi:hydantoinase/oxoprolinase family protein [Pantoea sp. App145]|uniref:hydantoinase/oxoprolinase family protein n=1 Tax=Pantoea sp. App145 TaxID=3071567 RepID=UPI003A7F7D7A